MANVRTTDMVKENEDYKIMCEKLWEFICRFLHHKMAVAGSFHLAFILTAITNKYLKYRSTILTSHIL